VDIIVRLLSREKVCFFLKITRNTTTTGSKRQLNEHEQRERTADNSTSPILLHRFVFKSNDGRLKEKDVKNDCSDQLMLFESKRMV